MKASLLNRLETLERRLAEINLTLASEDAARDPAALRAAGREQAELARIVACFDAWKRAVADRDTAEQMRADPELRTFAEEEVEAAARRAQEHERELQHLLLPRDPDDERNVFVEIRAGTGGEESALFAADLLRMYLRFAERQHWHSEIISAHESDLGGYREVIVRMSGSDVYARLKFESGVHRVQRVPETEAQGRIHTSACTVAVLPEADDRSEADIAPDELRIDVFRASGAGGQHVNRTESAVRITHLPTGIVVECQDDRSQHRNRDRALKILAARLKDRRLHEAQTREAEERRSLIGSGDRSERIRTYNFPQGRVTDHRINLTLYRLQQILDGDLDELLDALATEHQARLLTEFEEQHA